jgi:hypothetical protein
MKKLLFLLCCIFSFFISFGQKLNVNPNGNITDENKQILIPLEVKKLLANYPEQLALYDVGNTKKKIGNILLISGFGLIGTDLIISLTSDNQFPKMLSAIGLGAVALAIPVKIGYYNKIKSAVDGFNNNKKIGYSNKLEIIAKNTEIGLKLTFN